MKIIRNIKKVLRFDNVEYVKNTNQEHPDLEADVYLLVQTGGEEPMLFTKHQVEQAQKRAAKHPEDI